MSKKILVTGCGGDIGMAIGRILKESYPSSRIIGTDITMDGPGKFVFDEVALLPRAESSDYINALKELIQRKSISLVIPMSEPELRVFFKNSFTNSFDGVPVVMANPKTFEFGYDKLKTSQLLSHLNLPHPWTKLVSDEPISYPCIIKNRGLTGKGGVDIVEMHSVNYFRDSRPKDLWQEYLKGDEFTCGLYGTRKGEIRTIVFKRQLSNITSGFTSSGEVIENQEITSLLESLAYGMALRGSCNIQLRMTSNGPMVFEINPRFSSTVMFRHKLGFQDLLWSCSEAFGQDLAIYKAPKEGVRFYKGYIEYVDC